MAKGHVAWALRGQVARGVQENFCIRILRDAFSFILGHYILIFYKELLAHFVTYSVALNTGKWLKIHVAHQTKKFSYLY